MIGRRNFIVSALAASALPALPAVASSPAERTTKITGGEFLAKVLSPDGKVLFTKSFDSGRFRTTDRGLLITSDRLYFTVEKACVASCIQVDLPNVERTGQATLLDEHVYLNAGDTMSIEVNVTLT